MKKSIIDALRWLVFILSVLILNFPVISTLITSLKSDGEISSSASLWIEHPTFANYAAILAMADRFDILHFLANSLIASALGSFLAISCATYFRHRGWRSGSSDSGPVTVPMPMSGRSSAIRLIWPVRMASFGAAFRTRAAGGPLPATWVITLVSSAIILGPRPSPTWRLMPRDGFA